MSRSFLCTRFSENFDALNLLESGFRNLKLRREGSRDQPAIACGSDLDSFRTQTRKRGRSQTARRHHVTELREGSGSGDAGTYPTLIGMLDSSRSLYSALSMEVATSVIGPAAKATRLGTLSDPPEKGGQSIEFDKPYSRLFQPPNTGPKRHSSPSLIVNLRRQLLMRTDCPYGTLKTKSLHRALRV